MEIDELRMLIRARDFERTCRFYGEVLSLPRIQNWEREDGRGALYQAGPGVVEILGKPAGEEGRDERFDYQGPAHKLTLSFVVPSAEAAYEELRFRDQNIPGGLRREADGALAFETHDPDGVKIVLREEGR